MKTTRILLLLAAALLVAAPVYNSAWAAQPQRGPAPEASQARGPWQHPAIAPEKQAVFEKIIDEYHTTAQPLQNDMWAKRTELEYLSRADKANSKDISKLVGEMRNIREKMQALSDSTAARLAKDLGITNDHAYALLGWGGYGAGARGMAPCADGPRGDYRGYGGHRGYGDHRGGYGGYGGHRGWHR